MSDAPFRDPAESPTAKALARLAEAPVHPVRRVCAMIARYRTTQSARAHEAHISNAERRGFKLVGNAAEGLFPVYRKRIYVDAARTTQAQLSSRGYFFITYFESGACIITWNHTPRTPSSDVLLSRGTAGSFDADYDAHRAEVEKRAATDTPIVVNDLQTAVTLGDFYYRGVVALGSAAVMVLNVILPFAFAAFAIIEMLRRRG